LQDLQRKKPHHETMENQASASEKRGGPQKTARGSRYPTCARIDVDDPRA
jgi:hypothetical protein